VKKYLILIGLILCLGCESDDPNNFCDIINPVTVNLANPEFIDIQVPGGWAYANGGIKGLVIYNFGTTFKAFGRECPSNTFCAGKLSILNNIKLVCPCDNNEYSILDGSSQTAGVTDSVCEFKVTQPNSSILNISNF
jgi:hypothetical protein